MKLITIIADFHFMLCNTLSWLKSLKIRL